MSASLAPARAADAPTGFLVAGGDANAWIVSITAERDPASRLPIVQVITARRIDAAGALTPIWRSLDPLVGEIRAVCADRERLYLQFSDQSVSVLSADGATPGHGLPPRTRMRAWAGDVAGDVAYAIVSASVSQTADTLTAAPASWPAATTTLRLARFDGREWSLLSELPAAARDAGAWRLAVRDERLLLFCAETQSTNGKDPRRDVTLRCIEWSKAGWGAAHTLAVRPAATLLAAGWPSSGPALLIQERSADDAHVPVIRLFERGTGQWQDRGLIRDGPSSARADKAEWAIVHGGILAARIGAKGGIDAGWAQIKEAPAVDWSPIGSGAATPTSGWTAWLNSLATFAMIGFLFFLRPERLTTPPKLPPDLAVTLPLKRLLAAVIDFLPAILLTAYWWAPPLMALLDRARPMDSDQMQELRPYIESVLWWPKLLACVVYAAYCFAWEALTGATPGKHLLGCRVVDETGGRPTLMRLALRNALRLPELYVELMLLATLFLMLVASQRRQRIGDMLAETMVVSHTIPQARPAGQHPRGPGGQPPGGDSA